MFMQLLAENQSVDLGKELKLSGEESVSTVFGSPAAIIQALLPNLFLFAGLIVFIILIFGGITMIASGGDSKGMEKGRQAIQSAVVGFLLIFGAYWIIQIIQVVTGLHIFDSSV